MARHSGFSAIDSDDNYEASSETAQASDRSRAATAATASAPTAAFVVTTSAGRVADSASVLPLIVPVLATPSASAAPDKVDDQPFDPDLYLSSTMPIFGAASGGDAGVGGESPQLVPSDSLYSSQWHLQLIGRLGATNSTGIERVWNEFNGTGINVGIWDDGVQRIHQDLDGNYNAALHVNVAGVGVNLGQPIAPTNGTIVDQGHGTAVAGLIAAEANGSTPQGGSGVAFNAKVTGITIFNGAYDINTQGANYLASLSSLKNFDVTNHSYGISSQAAHFGGSDVNRIAPVVDSITNGRGGLGTINLAAAANNNAVNGEAWKHHQGVITVAAIDSTGQIASYSSYGPNVLISTPAGAVTTDLLDGDGYNRDSTLGELADTDYTNSFGGTSAATPVTAGVVALMLDANAGLGFRDVQDILAISAVGAGSVYGGSTLNEDYAWKFNAANNWNGGGMHYSENYGFGMVNAFQSVRFAESWLLTKPGNAAETLANQATATTGALAPNIAIPDLATTTYDFNLAGNIDIETVNLRLGLTHTFFTDLKSITLRSPEGTTISLTNGTGGSGSTSDGNWTFTFNLHGFKGENSAGTWRLSISDTETGDAGTLQSVNLTALGETPAVNDTYYYTDEALTVLSRPGQAGRLTLADTDGGTDWINMAGMYRNVTMSLGSMGVTSMAGTNFIQLASGTVIENAILGDGNDSVTGGLGANKIYGMRGNDTILGGQGNDTLYGGAGKDTTTGGGGLDYMVIQSLSDSAVAFAGRDVINTFAHGDKIDISAIDANSGVAGNQAFTFIGRTAFTGVAGQLRTDMTNISVTGVKAYTVYGDVNGDSIADFSLQIYTSPTTDRTGNPETWHLASWDFIL